VASEETIQAAKKVQRELVRKAIPKAAINGEFAEELKKLWNANEPIAITLDNWMQFINKSGFEGNVAYAPIQEYVQAAQVMSQQVQEELNAYWELCGITELMRGIADPQNAAATNQMISDHGDTRIQRIIDKVAIFFKMAYCCAYDVICDVFSEDTIIRDSASNPDDPQTIKAVQLMKNEGQRLFKVAIETGSTLAGNSGNNLAKSTEMFNILGQVLTLALQTAEKAPSYAQAMHSLIMHTVRSMSEGRKIEEELEQAFLQGLEQAKQGQEQAQQAQQAQQQQEQQMAAMQQQLQQFQMQIQSRETGVNEFEAQIKQFIAQSNAQIEQLKLQIEQATAGQKAQTDMALAQHQAQMTAQKTQAEVAKAQAEMVAAQQRVEMEAAKAGRELDIKEGQAIADTHLKKQELDDQRAVNLGELLTTGEVR
jgi:TolA-binding protein